MPEPPAVGHVGHPDGRIRRHQRPPDPVQAQGDEIRSRAHAQVLAEGVLQGAAAQARGLGELGHGDGPVLVGLDERPHPSHGQLARPGGRRPRRLPPRGQHLQDAHRQLRLERLPESRLAAEGGTGRGRRLNPEQQVPEILDGRRVAPEDMGRAVLEPALEAGRLEGLARSGHELLGVLWERC